MSSLIAMVIITTCSQLAQLPPCFIATPHQRSTSAHALPYLRDLSIETEVRNKRHCKRVLADDLDPGVPARRRGGCVEIKLAGHAWGLKGDIARVTAAMLAGGNGLCYRAVSAVGNSRGRQRT